MKKLLFIVVALSMILGACGGNYQPAKDCRAWVGDNVSLPIMRVQAFDREIGPETTPEQFDAILAEEQRILSELDALEELEACSEYDIKNTAYRLAYLYTEKHFMLWTGMPAKDGVGISVVTDHWNHILDELERAVPHEHLVLFGGLDGVVVERNGEKVYEVDHTGEHGHYPYYLTTLDDADYVSYSTTGRFCLVMIDRQVVEQKQTGKCEVNPSDFLPENYVPEEHE